MATVQYDDGTKVQFDGNPSQQDIEEAYAQKNSAQQNQSSIQLPAQPNSDYSQEDIVGQKMVTGKSVPKPQPPQQQMGKGLEGVENQLSNDISQFGKNLYSVTPFAKRIGQLQSLITGGDVNADDIYKQVGQPQGILQNISAMAGQIAPQIAMAAPFMKGANALMGAAQAATKVAIPTVTGSLIGGTIGSPMIRGAIGLGAYSGTKKLLEGGSGQEITDATTEGMTTGLIYGAFSKLGAGIIPKKIPFSNTIGSSVGAGIAGAMTSPDTGDKRVAQALFMGGLSALTPEEKFDLHKTIANNVTPIEWERYLRDGLTIPKEDTKTILDNGMNEVERVGNMKIQVPNQLGGTDTLGPVQMAQKFYDKGIQNIRYGEDGSSQNVTGGISKQFSDAIESSKGKTPKDINEFVAGLKQQVDKYGDPTSPIVRRFNTTYNALQGFNPTTTETDILGTKENVTQPISPRTGQVRTSSISELPPNLQAQARTQLGQKGDITNLSLNALHELKMNMYDAVSDKTWRDPGNTTPEERFAKSLGNQISTYIGKNNNLYQKANKEYSIMKSVQADIMGLNTQNLGKDWNQLDPALKIDLDNKLNGISSYFKQKGTQEYDPKGLLDKYHAYNSINNPDPTSFRNNAPLKVAFETGGAKIGALLGLPFGVSGAAIGGGIGYLTAVQYMRPKTYISILKQVEPNLKVTNSMSSQEAHDTLQRLISKTK